MTRRALFSPELWKQHTLLALGMGAAIVLLGCGGGGGGNPPGGGPGPGACGSPANNGVTVVCGYVVNTGSTVGVNGANVALKNGTGQTLRNVATIHNNATNRDGYYVMTVPAGATLLSVDAPSVGYLTTYMSYAGKTYDVTRTAQAGGPCYPTLPAPYPLPNGDNLLGTISLYPDTAAPPPPVFICPR
jgi:hypothetical protein